MAAGRAGPVLLARLRDRLHPLTPPDEGRYSGVAWEMLRSGDWIVPTEDGLPFFHKPPLFYWIAAAAMRLFGVNAAAARLAPLLFSFFAAVALHGFVRRRIGAELANAGTLVLATMPFFFAVVDGGGDRTDGGILDEAAAHAPIQPRDTLFLNELLP